MLASYPVTNLLDLGRGGDSARHHKGEPILKCRRCAKEEEERQKRESGMGCGYEVPPEDDTSEATLDLGCKKCQDRRKRRKPPVPNTSIMPSGMLNFGGGNGMLGPVRLAVPPSDSWNQNAMMAGRSCPGHARMGQTCPIGAVPLDPTLNCQRDARGNTVCSNGMYFPPGCPKTPPDIYFSPGIAPDEVHGTILEAKVPPARGTPGAPPLVGDEAAAAAATTAGQQLLNPGTNVLPYAAGGLAVVGLLYAIFR